MSASSPSEGMKKKIIESSVRFSASKLKREKLPLRMNGPLAVRITRGLIKFLDFFPCLISEFYYEREFTVDCRLFGILSIDLFSWKINCIRSCQLSINVVYNGS